ncbi:hypothetical protein IFM89_019628 [Coptis chinensis]|uniref:Auxin-responsive protein n=1 Tax=Coptis chinensis TaxID=261450 RepID=A0A835M8K0_9MAGN|nr:hypothetical protein IFM89_019628 [Coptis chinensis]
MEGSSSRNKEVCPKLLDLIHKDREWLFKNNDEEKLGVAEEKKLELRLGPPGEDERDESSLSYGCYASKTYNKNNTWLINNDGAIFSSPWSTSPVTCPTATPLGFQVNTQQQIMNSSYLHQYPSVPQNLSVKAMESSKTCCTKGVVGELQQSQAEKKACSQPSATIPANTAVNNSSQKRSAPPVVGWPPVRSFRKNLASNNSSKQVLHSQNGNPPPKDIITKKESCSRSLFVKINMDGVPIGRKVDLKANDSYEKLSSAVDELFRGLLAAQKDSPVTGNLNKVEDVKEITGLLDGSGEYTLVYEDNEGDRMLVGDVPWNMFASTVKRLRVLKSCELSSLCLGNGKQGKTPL